MMDEAMESDEKISVQHCVGRKQFAVKLVVYLAIIFFLPAMVKYIIIKTNVSGGYAAITLVIMGFALPIGLLLIGIPLAIITRRRLRDLNWTGALVLIFPIFPLLMLADGPIRAFTMLGIGGGNLLMDCRFWVGALLALCLSILPRYSDIKNKSKWLENLYGMLDKDKIKIDLRQYRKVFLSVIAIYVIFRFASSYYTDYISEYYKAGGLGNNLRWDYWVFIYLGLVVEVILSLVMIPVTYSRMKAIGYRPYLGVLLGLYCYTAVGVIVGMPSFFISITSDLNRIAFFISSPINFIMFFGSYIFYLLVAGFYIWLFFAKDYEQNTRS